MGQGEAGKPRVTCGVDGQAARSPAADAATASCVSTTPLGWPEVPEVATTSASPASTGQPVRQLALLAVRAHDASRPQCFEQEPLGDRGQPGVERRRRISGVPDRPEGVHKPHPTREVECNEFWHWPVA